MTNYWELGTYVALFPNVADEITNGLIGHLKAKLVANYGNFVFTAPQPSHVYNGTRKVTGHLSVCFFWLKICISNI